MMMSLFLVLSAALFPVPGQGSHSCAHRGNVSDFPENTLPAIQSAVDMGAAQIEFDVHRTRDGHLVIMHDNTVDRTTNGSGAVPDLSFEEIRALDAGSWFDESFAGTQVPTLEEVLKIIPHTILCNVHLRNQPEIAAKTAQIIKEMDKLDHCFLACTMKQKEEARAVAPEIMICNMDRQGGARKDYIDQTIEEECQFIQLHHQRGTEGLAADVKRLHDAGVRVNWFSAEEPPLMNTLIDAGIDYILTDRLSLLQQVLQERAEKSNP
jgi:glycerophosphoryl diester phosphodiesterase